MGYRATIYPSCAVAHNGISSSSQPYEQGGPGFPTPTGAAEGRGLRWVVCPERGWRNQGGKEQQGSEPKQMLFHGEISFADKLRRDNLRTEGVLFVGLR